MNLGIITNNFKMDWLDFKEKAGMIDENTRRLDLLDENEIIVACNSNLTAYTTSLNRCAKRLGAVTRDDT
jgi:hypothetical protein